MAYNKYSSRLRPLIEEYMVAVELKQHDKVFQLSLTINDCLVEILDDDLEESDQNETIENPSIEFKIISTICRQVRYQGHIAAVYDRVIEFVHLRDLICLSKLLGAIPDTDDVQNSSVKFDYNQSTRVLRQSIELLRFIKLNVAHRTPIHRRIWLDRNFLERKASIGFPKYIIDIQKATYVQEEDNDIEAMLASLNEKADPQSSEQVFNRVMSLMKSEWFVQFLHRTLLPAYPVDRFTILVAILIIGVDCRHHELVQLVYELLDQVYHEETNSCSTEDLMLLSQVGAFWLSYHKRHRATMKQANKQMMHEGFEDADELADDEVDSSPDTSSSSSMPAGSLAAHMKPLTSSNGHQSLNDLRTKLRRVIDDELLHGASCPICGHTPTDLLGPIKTGSNSVCSSCSLDLSSVGLRCAISHRPLEIVGLNSVLQLRPLKMVIMCPSEWIRELVAAKCFGLPGESDPQMVGEQLDISEKFERLTVLRGPQKVDSKYSPDDEDSDGSVDHGSSVSEGYENDCAQDRTNNDDDHLSVLRNFMKSRPDHVTATTGDSHQSEFILMLKFLRSSRGGALWLPICSSDILLLATAHRSSWIKVGLLSSARNLHADLGSILQCSSHSTISGLLLGCGEVFSSIELIRLMGQDSCLSEYSCPFCQRHLKEIRTLDEGLGTL